MENALGMAVVDCLEQLFHKVCSFFLAECLVLLLIDLFEELFAANVFHDRVKVFVVVVQFEVLEDIGMVKFVQDGHILNDIGDIFSELVFVKNIYSNFEVFIMSVCSHEHSTVGTDS